MCNEDGGEFKIRPPADNPAEKKGIYDPNYQTLAGMNNDDVFKRKDGPKDDGGGGGGGGGGEEGPQKIRAPQEKRVVGTYDPNYQVSCFVSKRATVNSLILLFFPFLY
ncbi:hypothetical protein COOONC_08725 [Cooperia oncophora]